MNKLTTNPGRELAPSAFRAPTFGPCVGGITRVARGVTPGVTPRATPAPRQPALSWPHAIARALGMGALVMVFATASTAIGGASGVTPEGVTPEGVTDIALGVTPWSPLHRDMARNEAHRDYHLVERVRCLTEQLRRSRIQAHRLKVELLHERAVLRARLAACGRGE